MAGKYTPLGKYLHDLPVSQKEVTMSFEQIERVLNDKLPPSAAIYLEWWANEKNSRPVQKQSWTNAGWQVSAVNLKEKWVRFVRG